MKELEVREYLGNKIEFKMIDGQIYANATSFNETQKLKDWKRSPKTQELIEELQANKNTEVENSHFAGLIISEKGGTGSGGKTWVHEELILDFAQYISVKLRVWCQKQITTLLREGTVSLTPKLPTNYLEALEALVVSEKEKQQLVALTTEQAPKVVVYDHLANSTSVHTMKEVADLLKIKGLGRNNLIALLKQKEILTKSGKPKRSYLEQGYFEVKVSTFSIHDEPCSTSTTKVTGKGLIWLTKLLKPETITQSKIGFK